MITIMLHRLTRPVRERWILGMIHPEGLWTKHHRSAPRTKARYITFIDDSAETVIERIVHGRNSIRS